MTGALIVDDDRQLLRALRVNLAAGAPAAQAATGAREWLHLPTARLPFMDRTVAARSVT